MNSDEAFEHWYETVGRYGIRLDGKDAWDACLEFVKSGQEPVALEKLFAELLKGTYSGKESYYNDEQISDACYAKAFQIALVAKKKGIELYTHPAPAQTEQGVTIELQKFALEIEKELCEVLGKQWRPSGMSIETLMNEVKGRLSSPAQPTQTLRYTNDGALAECPCCGSLDVGGAHDTVNCYSCGLTVKAPRPLQNAIEKWNKRTGAKGAAQPAESVNEHMLKALKVTDEALSLLDGVKFAAMRINIRDAIRKAEKARAAQPVTSEKGIPVTAQSAVVQQDKIDAERWRALVSAIEEDQPGTLEVCTTPVGYDSSKLMWVEFGVQAPEWEKPTAELFIAGVDAALKAVKGE